MPANFPEIVDGYCPVFHLASRHDHDTKQQHAPRALEQAMAARVDGERVFDVVQATFNPLEPSLAPLLRAAHAEGMGVIAKEVFANGRLTAANTLTADDAMVARLRATAARAGAAGLKDVEQRQNAGEGFGHASKLSRDSGRILSSIPSSVEA